MYVANGLLTFLAEQLHQRIRNDGRKHTIAFLLELHQLGLSDARASGYLNGTIKGDLIHVASLLTAAKGSVKVSGETATLAIVSRRSRCRISRSDPYGS